MIPSGRGLQAVKENLPKEAAEGIVFIHDGARPMVSEDILERCSQDAQNIMRVLPQCR